MGSEQLESSENFDS
jgi:hypothetical protein